MYINIKILDPLGYLDENKINSQGFTISNKHRFIDIFFSVLKLFENIRDLSISNEIDVLKGADIILKSKSLKVIGIELHSEILNKKGIKFPENIIENILTNNGFKYKWVDFSHIVAFR